MNILIIVEGSKTEQSIFKYILPKYGFNEIIIDKKLCKNIDFSYYNFSDMKDNVIVIEGPKNRIKDVIEKLKKMMIYIDTLFLLG